MSFFRKIKDFFKKLRGKKDEQPAAQVYPTIDTTAVTPAVSYPGIGKFNQPPEERKPPIPEVTVPEHPVNQDWPPGTSSFYGTHYVPYRGQSGGPFETPAQAYEWMARIDQWYKNTEANTQADGRVYTKGKFDASGVLSTEAMYLYAANRVFQEKTQHSKGNLFWDFGILNGYAAEINSVINAGERHFVESHYPAQNVVDEYQGRFKAPVQQAFASVGL